MSTFIPIVKSSPLELNDRRWLMRVRGTTLSAYADAANQLAFRNGLTMYSKAFTRPFTRDGKATGGGHINVKNSIGSSTVLNYSININPVHPAADSLGLMLTYVAPFETSEIRIRLKQGDGNQQQVDPVVAPWAIILSEANGTLPLNRVIEDEDYFLETLDSSGDEESTRLEDLGSSADLHRFNHTMCVEDAGTRMSTRPRRLRYQGLNPPGSSGNPPNIDERATVEIQAVGAILVTALAFEIPKLTI